MKKKSINWKRKYIIMNASLMIIIFLISSCCKTREIIIPQKEILIKTEIKEIIRDTTLYIPADESSFTAWLECDSLGNVLMNNLEILQGKLNAQQEVKVKNNIVYSRCICDSMKIYMQLKDRLEQTITSETQTQLIFKEKELNWWQKTGMWTGGITFLALILKVLLFLLKRYR